MGLDLDLVKFDKARFDSLKDGDCRVRCSVLIEEEKELQYWRKKHAIKGILCELTDTYHRQAVYAELPKILVERALWIAKGKPRYGYGVDSWRAEMKLLIPALEKTLAETDFDKETVAVIWLS